ncbi:MAG: hypothetical protein ACKOXU_03440, partial [Limnohabitans sp.]
MQEIVEVIEFIRKNVEIGIFSKGCPACLLHERNGKTFSFPKFLAKPVPSGAIHPTFLIGGWLRVSQGVFTGNALDPYLTLEKLAMKKSLIALAV